MVGNVCVHTRPVETLEEVLFSFVDAVVPGEKLPMSLRQCIRDQSGGQEEYHPAWLKLSLNLAPHQPVLYEAVICKKFYQSLALGVLR